MPELNPSDFNVIDWVLIVVIFISGLIGLFLGLVREVVTLFVWAAAIIATIVVAPQMLPWASQHISDETIASIVTYGGTFVVTLIIAWMLGFAINSALHGKNDDVGMGLSPLNKLLGFFYGLARGVIVICVMYFVALMMLPNPSEFDLARHAQTIPVIHDVTGSLYRAIPEPFRTEFMSEPGEKLNLPFAEAFQQDAAAGLGDAPAATSTSGAADGSAGTPAGTPIDVAPIDAAADPATGGGDLLAPPPEPADPATSQ